MQKARDCFCHGPFPRESCGLRPGENRGASNGENHGGGPARVYGKARLWYNEITAGDRPKQGERLGERREIPEFSYRLKVKAGLTGYAQVYGKYNTTAYDKLKLDLTYIRKYSVFLDLKLILMTPKIMLLKESTEGVKESPAEQSAREEAAAASLKD